MARFYAQELQQIEENVVKGWDVAGSAFAFPGLKHMPSEEITWYKKQEAVTV